MLHKIVEHTVTPVWTEEEDVDQDDLILPKHIESWTTTVNMFKSTCSLLNDVQELISFLKEYWDDFLMDTAVLDDKRKELVRIMGIIRIDLSKYIFAGFFERYAHAEHREQFLNDLRSILQDPVSRKVLNNKHLKSMKISLDYIDTLKGTLLPPE